MCVPVVDEVWHRYDGLEIFRAPSCRHLSPVNVWAADKCGRAFLLRLLNLGKIFQVSLPPS